MKRRERESQREEEEEKRTREGGREWTNLFEREENEDRGGLETSPRRYPTWRKIEQRLTGMRRSATSTRVATKRGRERTLEHEEVSFLSKRLRDKSGY